jgi:hypothetical protein
MQLNEWVFWIAFALALMTLAVRWVRLRKFLRGSARMTPAQILGWRLAKGEIDVQEYILRMAKLQQVLSAATDREVSELRSGGQR